MDLLINYPEFKQEIEHSFHDLIIMFNLNLKELHEGSYLLEGLKCNIRFTYDRGDIFCDFKQPHEYQDSPGYGVWAVYKFLDPQKELIEKSERIYDTKLQLRYFSNLIQNNLENVLKGDFSWLKDFLKERERRNKMLNIALHLDRENPIAKKFWKGDQTWQNDIEEYVKENKINL
jgi:hypothetical protein